ncbi:hypothetical protein [Microcoleus sp. Pol17C6]
MMVLPTTTLATVRRSAWGSLVLGKNGFLPGEPSGNWLQCHCGDR